MSWLDDLKVRAEQALDNIKGDAAEYLKQRTAAEVVKIAQPRAGNLTAAQIAEGQRGSAAPIAGSEQFAALSAQVQSLASNKMVLIGAGVVVLVLLLRRR